MKTLNSEPRITFNWVPGAWAGYGYTGAPTLKADAFDLAMAMAELRNVAAERDALKIERDETGVRADFADLAAERRGAELDKFKAAHQIAVAGWNAAAIERDSANWSLSRAKESLRAAEADLAETEGINSDLRTVNARLVADLAAAVQRADTAEELFACAGLRGRY